ncbi:MAG: SDR family oxidoreductase [Paracoccus sp. (in: a-proteobacteria)]|nr:SDR family oxidoreductase [Paracoccus sp. (in: a-proteobacteria)]
MDLVILGHGYSAAALSERAVARGWRVFGTTRRDPARVTGAGAVALDWDRDQPEIARLIREADAILSSVPTSRGQDPVLARHSDDLRKSRAFWIGYLSSTNVYGDHRGGWVDETTPAAPSTTRAKARLAAEAGWRELAADEGLPLHIFRLAGIYGPGRGPFEKLRNGTARRLIKPDQIFSRIHRDDIGGAIWASVQRPSPGAIYNLCDDQPAPPEDVIAHAAALLGMTPPPSEPFETAEMTDMARSFYADSKRVSNRALRDKLGYQLEYPDYDSGLRAILAAEAKG